ncbi:flagellin [Selenomonas ruminantium]|jgi:flagellin|uniref:Flagellin n=2 Tax=Selenomonas TaxID=970 RepID=A0A1I3HUN6_SELRU|nr:MULTISPECIES: flagellin [Selenomonas]SFI39478.1 flagellin [Selenomonas ruminantium]
MSINGIMSGVNHSLNTLNKVQSAQSSSVQKIATGSKYPSASYGPSDYAIIQRTYSNIGAVAQSNSNTQTANSMLSTAAGAVNETVNSLSSLRSTLLEAANGTNGNTDLAALQKSVEQTISSIDDNASVTYNGKKLLDGSQSITVAGADGYNTVSLGNMTSQGLGLTDSEGKSTIDLTDASSISAALDKVDSALNAATDQATNIGAAQQGLTYQSSNYTTQEENLVATAETMDSADIAKESVNLASSNTQEQAALWAIKQGMQSLSQQSAGALGGLNNHSRGAAVGMLM